jgi:hypothetical protein
MFVHIDDDSEMEDMFQKVFRGKDIDGHNDEPLEDPHIARKNAHGFFLNGSSHTCFAPLTGLYSGPLAYFLE